MDALPPVAATRTTCPYCGVGCGVLARADGRVAGDPDHPANAGRLCSKGAALGETIGLEERLLYPEVDGKRASWVAALDLVAEGFSRALRERGPGGVALYVSGQLLTEDYYAANKFAKGVLGTANIDSNSRLCMSSAVAAHQRAFGEDLVPGTYADLEAAELVVLVGSNLAWCHPVLHQRVLAARAARAADNPLRIVVIDPRRTASCEGADLHLPLHPGSDVALFAALLVHLHDHGHAAPGRAEGVAAALDAARPVAAQAAELTGLDPASIARFCALFAASPRVVTLWSQGVNQSSAGTDKANAILNVHLLTGRVGRPGAGPFSITGQPNAMGGREVGALATLLAGHLHWNRPGDRDLVAGYWGLPNVPHGPGLAASALFDALGAGAIGALWIFATNPAVSMPRADAARDALAAAPLLVVSEVSRRSDTLRHARVRLPALGWGEKDGTVTNSERVISRQRAFLPPPGEARPDWWAVAQVAARLGHGAAFAWDGPAAIFREHAALTGIANDGARRFDISALAGLSDAAYDAMPPTRWPCPAAGPAPARLLGPEDPWAARVPLRLVPTPFRAAADRADAERPITLLTGRLRDQWHTMTRTGGVPRLMAQAPEPTLSLHPDDAPAPAGALVRAAGAHGAATLRLRLDPGLPRGVGFAPMHWGERFAPAARINAVLRGTPDPVSYQPELKHAPIAVTEARFDWQGFLLAPTSLDGLAEWSAVSPQDGGWLHELAGTGVPAAAFAALRARVADAAEWLLLEDAGAGLHRGAALEAGVLRAVVAVAPGPDLPPRAWLASLLGQTVPPAASMALLAGRPSDAPPPTPLVCACNGVREGALLAAIAAGARSVAALGTATAAGTGCGACRPELAALLASVRQPVAA